MIRLNTTLDYLDWAFRDAGIAELRHHDGKHWITGWFDRTDSLLQEARQRASAGNLYISLNAPKPRIVSNTMRGKPVRDDDIGWIVRLPFDFDPVRPTGFCSTDEELGLACERRDRFIEAMCALGWPMPLRAKSGNGYHAVYRIRLPVNIETKQMLKSIYYGLHTEFDTQEVSFDRSVRNPGRIFRLYGSKNRKGPNTPNRPHRRSTVWIPKDWSQVTQKQIENLANVYVKRAQKPVAHRSINTRRIIGVGDYSSLDVVTWFQSHGLHIRHIEDNKHAVICPWRAEHTTEGPSHGGDSIIYESDGGWPGFYCHHSHCEERRLQDVINLLGDADQFCSTAWRAQR
ncbi:MAG: hypothetical protein KZQ92_16210 [Candidatus Thiodiazotropha sp. (ex Lucinoma borealis)]|nr:hypothetical protein [Candidatus Thiodiazotropha sp. (ex Lucinoma borealis)]